MNELALFAGAGGGILAGHLLGWRTVCAVERDPYAVAVLAARQNEGALPPFPVWDDVATFDGRPWRGAVDVVSGGFPCQDISVAGKRAGIDGERSGLWSHMARIVGEVRPRFVCVENSPALTVRGLGRVLGDLAALGFDAEWGVLGAADVGAPHQRDRIWILAYAQSERWPEGRPKQHSRHGQPKPSGGCGKGAEAADPDSSRQLQPSGSQPKFWRWPSHGDWWQSEPDVVRVVHGLAHRVDRIACIGNGQVPQCAAEAFTQLKTRLGLTP